MFYLTLAAAIMLVGRLASFKIYFDVTVQFIALQKCCVIYRELFFTEDFLIFDLHHFTRNTLIQSNLNENL